uniref:Uncharacterized protein n=1 Tax=Oryza brachyantha TaxID=4533 RepID=J3LFW5_ORYBR
MAARLGNRGGDSGRQRRRLRATCLPRPVCFMANEGLPSSCSGVSERDRELASTPCAEHLSVVILLDRSMAYGKRSWQHADEAAFSLFDSSDMARILVLFSGGRGSALTMDMSSAPERMFECKRPATGSSHPSRRSTILLRRCLAAPPPSPSSVRERIFISY